MRLFLCLCLSALTSGSSLAETIDLSTALRLGGTQNLDLQLIRNSIRQAQASHAESQKKFFPWITTGIEYRRHDGNIQDVIGEVSEVNKQSYQAGAAIVGELRLGEAIYQSLAAKQRVTASRYALAAANRNLAADITAAYFDLLKAQATASVCQQSKQLSAQFLSQISAAVTAGIAFEADQYRAQIQSLRHDLSIRKAQEDIDLASSRLANLLSLPATTHLRGVDAQLVPIHLIDPNSSLSQLIHSALDHRPELRSREAMLAAAQANSDLTTKGALIPNLSLRASSGGLGGGRNHQTGNFDDSSELVLGIGWRIGAGGLFDQSRIESSLAAEQSEKILLEKTRQRITREVIDSLSRLRSIQHRLQTAKSLLDASEKAYQLSLQRNTTGVGNVLETLRSEEDLSFSRLLWFDLVAEYNKSQSTLHLATAPQK